MTQPQRDFLEDEFLTLSINGALQHSSTYKPTAGKKDPETLQRELRTGLCDIAARYSSEVGEGQHLENIQELARRVNKSCASFLNGDHLRFGVAQKALNLYLKYLWCVGKTRIRVRGLRFDEELVRKRAATEIDLHKQNNSRDKSTRNCEHILAFSGQSGAELPFGQELMRLDPPDTSQMLKLHSTREQVCPK